MKNLTLLTLAVTMAVSLGCGLAIYLLYRHFYRGFVYSDNFGILIVIVSGITAFIIITIGTNLVLSLGMVAPSPLCASGRRSRTLLTSDFCTGA